MPFQQTNNSEHYMKLELHCTNWLFCMLHSATNRVNPSGGRVSMTVLLKTSMHPSVMRW